MVNIVAAWYIFTFVQAGVILQKIMLFKQFFWFIGGESDERVSNSVSLKSKLATSYEPEVIKDILFDLHEISEQSHAKVYFVL